MIGKKSFVGLLPGILGIVLTAATFPDVTAASAALKCTIEPTRNARLSACVPSVVIPRIAPPPTIDGTLAPDEWRGAALVNRFLVPMTTKRAAPPTTMWLAVDGRNLYAAARCTVAAGAKLKTDVHKHDAEIWQDDSLEFFFQPDTARSVYYQFVVNPAGVFLDYRLSYGKSGLVDTDRQWSSAAEIRTSRESRAWTLEMAVPLSELGIAPHGVKVIRLNLCRNDFTEGERLATWIYMPVSNYHRLADYGIGICTFDRPRDARLNMNEVRGWGSGELVRVTDKRLAVLLPNGCQTTARVTLPDQLFSDTEVFLEPAIRVIGDDGKPGEPLGLGRFRLTSSQPLTISLSGLEPGDYRLDIGARAPGLALSQDVRIAARTPSIAPQIVGPVVLDERDWTAPDKVARSENVERELGPELLLKTEFKAPVLAFEPTTDETITCMTEFNGKLYVGSCTAPSATDTGSVFTYDVGLDLWDKAFQVNEQGLVQMKVYGDRLYIPGYDANDGDWDLGNIYIHDGKSWVERRTVPRAIHIYGLAKHRGRIYVSADILDAPPEGVPFQQALSKDMLQIYGRVVSSDDEGMTWREEYRGPEPGQDVGFMTVFDEKIVLNARGDLIICDGQKWVPLGLNPNVLCVYDYAVDGKTLLLATSLGLAFYDGRQFRLSDFGRLSLRAVARYGRSWVMAGYYVWRPLGGHGPGGTGYPEVKDGTSITPLRSVVEVVPAGTLDVDIGGTDRESKQVEQVTWMEPAEVCVSCAVCRGRVYLGTHPTGRLLALPVAAEGTLDSVPRRIEEAGQLRLWWQGETPRGTSIRFQVRSAPTVAELEGKPFVGPNGSEGSYFERQGETVSFPAPGFLQYRVVLKTTSPARSPYLREVVFTRSD